MLRHLIASIALVSLCSLGWADDNREKRAAAQFLFEKEKAKAEASDTKVKRAELLFSAREVAPMPKPAAECDCHQTASCHCVPGSCDCCADHLPDYAKQAKLATEKRLVIVAYFGTKKGTCFDGAVSGATMTGQPLIRVGYGADGKLLESEVLPLDATRDEIMAAIARAAAKRDTVQAPPVVIPVKPQMSFAVPVPHITMQVCKT